MKIVVDCRYVRMGHHDGISRYTVGLVTALSQLHPITMLISDRRQLAALPDCPWALVSHPTSIREPFVALQVNRMKPDVVFSPMQTMGSWGRGYKLVLTVHDLIYYSHPTAPPEFSWFIRALWRVYHSAWWPQRLLLRRADAVVSVSETTKSLLGVHRLVRSPVVVVPNAADVVGDSLSQADSCAPWSDRRRSLVYMGSFMPYKNVETVVRAMLELPEYELHLLSRISDTDRDRLRALAPGARLIFHNGVSDSEYFTELRRAIALVSASRDEGFGIPLVESMAVGTPIVVSDIPIFHEIGGEVALYFSADDPTALATAIRDLDQETHWSSRSAAVMDQSANFAWQKSAHILLKLLRSLAQ